MTALSPSSPSEKYRNGSNQANVKVVVRIRPLILAELSNKYENVTEAISDHMLVFDPKVQQVEGFLHTQRRNITGRRFKDLKYAFDHVLRSSARNRDVFEISTQSIVKTVLKGYNCSVFAYGATGSGKTHTMLGNEDEPGVIYHTMLDLYKHIEARKDEKIFNVAVSYLEIYNETVRDLLNPKKNLPIREDKMAGVMIAGLSLHKPECAEDLLHMLHHGNKNRSQHPTDANAESSRSHAVFQVFVKQRSRAAGTNSQVQMAKMCLVDLAGSERAIHTRNVGARFREGANINRSLLALGNVINALAAKSKGHIPYRDSKLTRLLKDSLGGNCQTVMIATISPSSRSYEDTYNTLRYADRAKHIKADLTRNVVNVDQHIVNYKIYVADLERENRDLREKARLLQESSALSSTPPAITVIKQIQDKVLELFKARKDIMRTQITSEVVKRELKWKLSRKERAIKRVEMLTGLKDAVTKHQRKADRMQSRYLKEEVNIQKTTQQLKQHDQSIYTLNTELASQVNGDKASREHLAMSMRYYVTDSYLCDLDMHLCFVKKMARAQERQSVVNERIILSLIQLVKKQQDILKNDNVSNPEVEQAYKECCYLVEERGVAWVQQHSKSKPDDNTATTNIADGDNGIANLLDDEDKEDLRISDIIDIQLPKIALNSLKLGSFGSPPKKKKQEELGTTNHGCEEVEPAQKLGTKLSWQPKEQRQHVVPQSAGDPARHLESQSSESSSQKVPNHSLFDVGIKTTGYKGKDTSNGPVNGGTVTMSGELKSVTSQGIRGNVIPQLPIPQPKENCSVVEGGNSINNTCATTTTSSDSKGQFCPSQNTVSVKKMVEKYSNKDSIAGPNALSGSNMKLSALGRTSGGYGNNGPNCKRSLYTSLGVSQSQQHGAATAAVNTTLTNQRQSNRVTYAASSNSHNPGGGTLLKQASSSYPDIKEDNENDITPTSDKLNETFEIDKPAIPNTPCIDGPLPKQRRVAAITTNNNRKQSNGHLYSPLSSHKNHSNSSYQQKFLHRQLCQASSPGMSVVDKPFNRRLSMTTTSNANAANLNEQKIKFILESPNNVSKKLPLAQLPAIKEQMGDIESNEVFGVKPNATDLPLMTKSILSRELDKLQKFSKLRASSSPSRFLTSTPQPTPPSSSSPASGVKSSPCLNKWDLIRERGVTRGSKLWRSLSAQQLGMGNNNNSSIDEEKEASPLCSGVADLLDRVQTSSPKMEVEVCISPSQGEDSDSKDSGGVNDGGLSEEVKTVNTPEFQLNPYMHTVIRSLKKHGIPSLTERLSLLPEANPAPTSPSHRERSPLRILDVNTSKYQPKRPLGNNQNKLNTLQEKQPKKVEPVAFSFPSLTNTDSDNLATTTTTTTMKYRLDRTKGRKHQREQSAKPYSRETILANRGQRLAAALKKMNSVKDSTNQDPSCDSNSNGSAPTATTSKPSYMLSTFAASQRVTGLPGREKTNKLSSWSVLSQQAIAAPAQRRPINGQRNKSYLPWLQS